MLDYDDLENDISFLAEFSQNNKNKLLDFAGRLAINKKGEPIYNFGKHKDKTIKDVFIKEPSYHAWMLNNDFPFYTKQVLKEVIDKLKIEKKEYQAKKYGTALYYSLIDLLKCQRYRNVVAGITLPNIPSVSFHERFGFHQVGVYDNVGFKLGKSQRVGWWQLSLVDHMQPAEAIIPLDQVLKTEEGQKALKRGELRLMI